MKNRLILILSFSITMLLTFFFTFYEVCFYVSLVLLVFSGVKNLVKTIHAMQRKKASSDSAMIPKGHFYFEARLNRCMQNAFYLGVIVQCLTYHRGAWLIIPFSIIMFARIQNVMMALDFFPEKLRDSLKHFAGVIRLFHHLSAITVGLVFLTDLL